MTADLPHRARATPAPSLTGRPQWRSLHQHFREMGGRHLRELFAEEPLRGERFVAEGAGLYLDYSKQRITDETLRLLTELAGACGLPERISAMFRGDRINVTEQRAVLHPETAKNEHERKAASDPYKPRLVVKRAH